MYKQIQSYLLRGFGGWGCFRNRKYVTFYCCVAVFMLFSVNICMYVYSNRIYMCLLIIVDKVISVHDNKITLCTNYILWEFSSSHIFKYTFGRWYMYTNTSETILCIYSIRIFHIIGKRFCLGRFNFLFVISDRLG